MKPPNRIATKEDLQRAIADIAFEVGKDLAAECSVLLEKLTPSEISEIITWNGDQFPYRLAKALVVAITESGRVERQFNAESLRPAAKRLERIYRRRP